MLLHRSHELEVRGDVSALVSGWQDAEQELIAANQGRESVLAELAIAQAENQRLKQACAKQPPPPVEIATASGPPREPGTTPAAPPGTPAEISDSALEAVRIELVNGRRQLENQTGLLSQARLAASEFDERVTSLPQQVAELEAQRATAQAQAKASNGLVAGVQAELNSARALAGQVTELQAQVKAGTELAAARVVLETLREERALWQAQSKQAQTDTHAAMARLAAGEERQRQLEQAAERAGAALRRTLELATAELAPSVSALQAALARPAEAGET